MMEALVFGTLFGATLGLFWIGYCIIHGAKIIARAMIGEALEKHEDGYGQ